MRLRLTLLLLLCFALPAYATDTLTVQVDRDNGTTQITDKLVLTPSNIGAGATYTILPYGDTRRADYYCSATDCAAAFQSAVNAITASGKGGKIKALEGVYPFATTVQLTDADSIAIEGISPVGMWATGGTTFRRTANVTVFNFTKSVSDPNACEISRIHFADTTTGYTAPVLKYVNAHNMGQFLNYFDAVPQAIYAERPWDFWTQENNFRDCGTGDSKDTACIGIYNGSVDQASGWMITHNRFETRTGTSIYSDASGSSGGTSDGANTINVSFNKFEGIDTKAYPAVHGVFWSSRFIGNSVFKADTGKPAFWLVNANGAYSGTNVIANNTVSSHKTYAISIADGGTNISGNAFFTQDTPTAHIRVEAGATGNGVGLNTQSDSITMLSDLGTGTFALSKLVDNTAYDATSWNGDSAHAPSKDAVRDKIEALTAQISAAGGGTVMDVSSADSNLSVTNGTVHPSLTVVAAPKLATARTINGASFDGTGNVGQDLQTTASPSFVAATLSGSGSNMVTNGTLAGNATGWTSSAGNALPFNNWSYSSGTLLHTAGATQTVAQLGTTATIGTTYKVSYDVVGMTTGTVQVNFGNVGGTTASANGTYISYITATAATLLNFVPSSAFDGAIDNISVIPLSAALTAGSNLTVAADGTTVTMGPSSSTTTGAAALTLQGNQISPSATIRTYISSATSRPTFTMAKYRGNVTTPTTVVTGDKLGSYVFSAYDGAALQSPSTIDAYAEGTVSSGAVPARLEFVTGTNSSDRAARLKVFSTSGICGGASGCTDPGSGKFSWTGDVAATTFNGLPLNAQTHTQGTSTTLDLDANDGFQISAASGTVTLTTSHLANGKYFDIEVTSTSGALTLNAPLFTGATFPNGNNSTTVSAGKSSHYVCKGTGSSTAKCYILAESK